MSRRSSARYERYDFSSSPWVQKLKQRDLAHLVGLTRDDLRRLIRDKEHYISRRPEEIGGKLRNLAIPKGKLRGVHELLKFHLNKIRQPEYVFSPRKGVSQKDNAQFHSGGAHILKIDVKQFYPTTTQEDIFRWAFYCAGMLDDVAGMFAKIVAIDRRMPFGSPVSPVLTSHVHRPIFDRVHEICSGESLLMSLWVDNLTISGAQISGSVLRQIRGTIREGGFGTHDVEFLQASRSVVISGIPVERGRVKAPLSLHRRIQSGYDLLRQEQTDIDRTAIIEQLLSHLGTYRYLMGANTTEGRKVSDRMHALKQRYRKLYSVPPNATRNMREPSQDTPPWEE